MVGQLAGAQAQVAGVVLPIDEGDAFSGELLGELGHQHLVAALVVPVGFLDMGEQGIADDLPQGEAGDPVLHLQYASQQVVGLVVVQHFVGLGDVLVEGGRPLVPPGGVVVQKGLYGGNVRLGDGPERPIPIGFQEFVHMVALAAELFPPEIFQILSPVEVVEAVPLPHGGAGGEELLELLQLVLGHGVEGDGHAPAAAVVGNLPEVLRPPAPQG